MRPSYSSASYRFQAPTLEVSESEILTPHLVGGWRCHTAMGAAPYTNSQLAAKANAGFIQKSASHSCSKLRKAQILDRPFHVLKEVEHLHNVNIQRSLTHRIQMAKQRDDQRLLDALESESRAIAPF